MNVKTMCRDSDIVDIAERSLAGEDLTREDGIVLFESNDLLSIGALADELRRRSCGDIVTFVVNRHINYTNVCVSGCKFCAYYREKGEAGAYTMSMAEIMKKIGESIDLGITELHIVGSHHPDLPFEFYVDMLEQISAKYPGVHIQAFTATEIDYFSGISGRSIKNVLKNAQKCGPREHAWRWCGAVQRRVKKTDLPKQGVRRGMAQRDERGPRSRAQKQRNHVIWPC